MKVTYCIDRKKGIHNIKHTCFLVAKAYLFRTRLAGASMVNDYFWLCCSLGTGGWDGRLARMTPESGGAACASEVD